MHASTSTISPSLVCAGMIFTFYKARGIDVGASMVEEDQLGLAKKLESMAADKGVKLILPTDVVAAEKFSADAQCKEVRGC